jgi:hypothetical protein
VNQTFGSFAPANTYFTDNALSLGSFSGNTTVDFEFTFTSANSADSYDAELVVADVPKPGTVWMVVMAGGVIAGWTRAGAPQGGLDPSGSM